MEILFTNLVYEDFVFNTMAFTPEAIDLYNQYMVYTNCNHYIHTLYSQFCLNYKIYKTPTFVKYAFGSLNYLGSSAVLDLDLRQKFRHPIALTGLSFLLECLEKGRLVEGVSLMSDTLVGFGLTHADNTCFTSIGLKETNIKNIWIGPKWASAAVTAQYASTMFNLISHKDFVTMSELARLFHVSTSSINYFNYKLQEVGEVLTSFKGDFNTLKTLGGIIDAYRFQLETLKSINTHVVDFCWRKEFENSIYSRPTYVGIYWNPRIVFDSTGIPVLVVDAVYTTTVELQKFNIREFSNLSSITSFLEQRKMLQDVPIYGFNQNLSLKN